MRLARSTVARRIGCGSRARSYASTSSASSSILADLAADSPIGVEQWVEHCAGKEPSLGWPRVLAQLSVLKARLEKVAEMEAAMG